MICQISDRSVVHHSVASPCIVVSVLACVSENGANVLDIDHKREDAKTEVSSCVVTMTLETVGNEQVQKIKADLQKRGYQLLF